MIKRVISKTEYPRLGYKHIVEMVRENEDEEWCKLDSAYDMKDNYLGSIRDARRRLLRNGIIPEYHKHASIGFCKMDQHWYGWSHRGMYGFGIGDTVNEGDCTASCGSIQECVDSGECVDLSLPVGFVAKTLEDAKLMAIAYSESIS